jgi:D-glycero-alpha-D-manno-heptose-7-phosphate kinase
VTYQNINSLVDDNNQDIVDVVIRHFRPVFGFNLFLRSDVPPQAGLGGSAAAFAAVIGLFNHLLQEKRMDNYEIAELAFRLEREEMRNPGGRQDQYATTFGGVNFFEFKGNDFVRINPLKIKRDVLLDLEKHLVLVNIGTRRKSGNVILDQVKRYSEKIGETDKALHATKALAVRMKYALLSGNLVEFGDLLDDGWHQKKQFSPLVTNAYIDSLYRAAQEEGAMGGKITGAGGGGHMLFFCKPNRERAVMKALEDLGARVVDFGFDEHGLETWESTSEGERLTGSHPGGLNSNSPM